MSYTNRIRRDARSAVTAAIYERPFTELRLMAGRLVPVCTWVRGTVQPVGALFPVEVA